MACGLSAQKVAMVYDICHQVKIEICMTPQQCVAARTLLRWDQSTLAERAGVTRQTISSFERATRNLHQASHDGIEVAFMVAGIDFIDSRGVLLEAKDGQD
ncbi:helix-turn-helix transcriptional regulator [Pseudomonas aeruginosa]|nr:helix-turn-helix transcriptional regulator [Pseudomonas aeruginosa]